MKVRFVVYPDGTAYVTDSESLEEAKAELEPEEAERVSFAEHSSLGGVDHGLEIIVGAHHLALDGGRDSSLEQLATTLIRAGMAIERRKMSERIGRTLQP